jgi:uncharacterized membrane protein
MLRFAEELCVRDESDVAPPRPSLQSGGSLPLVVIALLAIAFGTFFRFYHIDRKVYWGDEAYTSLRMLGYTEAKLVERAPAFRDVGDLRLVLHPTPAEGATNPFAPALGLAREEAHHPPLYYELGHFWLAAFGNSIGATRSLSALISLFALPLAFWLGVELYGSRRAAWIAVALFALSPLAILYAQEAREYALWTVVLLALYATLLRALRLDRAGAWWPVALLGAIGLYVFPLTLLPLAGLAAYVVAIACRTPRTILRCGVALGAATIVYLPWLMIVLLHFGAVTDSLSPTLRSHIPAGEILRAFAGSLRLTLFDANAVHSSHVGVAATALVLLTLVAAFSFVARREQKRVTLFLASSILFTTVPLLLLDVITGSQVARNPRYFTPAFISLDLCLVGLLYALVSAHAVGRRLAGYAVLVACLTAAVCSSFASSRATTWWTKEQDESIAVAAEINQTSRPLIVSDDYLSYALVLSNYVNPETPVALRPVCYECSDRYNRLDAGILPRGRFTDLFSLGPSQALQSLLRSLIRKRHLRLVYHCINVRNNCRSTLNIEPVYDGPP